MEQVLKLIQPVKQNEVEIIDVPSLGMWLFLGSEAMFFIAMLGAFVVLESTGQQHALFAKSSQMLSKFIGLSSAIMLVIASVYLGSKNRKLIWAAPIAGMTFICLQWVQWTLLLLNHTAVFRESGRLVVSDGRTGHSHRIDLPAMFDVHAVTAADFAGKPAGTWPKQTDEVLIDQDYGPSRNNFFASYFLMSAAHGVHLLAGLLAILWFLLFRRGGIPAALQNYWHFVNVVGIIGLAAVYFV